MRGTIHGTPLRVPAPAAGLGLLLLLLPALGSCGGEETSSAAGDRTPVERRLEGRKTPALARAARRAYDGAPPVIPHAEMGATCTACHNERGLEVPGVGFAPPSPHEATRGLSALSNCRQCHVFHTTDETFVDNDFVGLPQDLREGPRAYEGAPPVLPHGLLMHENCAACHTGPAAREEIRTSHPERANCLQCHAVPRATGAFTR